MKFCRAAKPTRAQVTHASTGTRRSSKMKLNRAARGTAYVFETSIVGQIWDASLPKRHASNFQIEIVSRRYWNCICIRNLTRQTITSLLLNRNHASLLQTHACENRAIARMHRCQNDTRQIFKLKSYRASSGASFEFQISIMMKLPRGVKLI